MYSQKSHYVSVILACGSILLWNCLSPRPLRADQIVVLVDKHGHKVYINTGEPARTALDWMTRSFRPLRSQRSPLSQTEINQLVEHTAGQFQVDPQLVHAIIEIESDYNPNAVSRKGAMGLMQLIPSTAERFGVANPFDPQQNILGGVTYLKYLMNLFGGDLALSLAAYNAGENAVQRYGGIPSFAETRDYVRKVSNRYKSGSVSTTALKNSREPYKAPIYRYVDAAGVVHYTNVE